MVTALLSDHDALASASGMFSALGNIGPCYIPNAELPVLHPVTKIVCIAGMSKADVAVGTMRADADNLAFAVLAKSFDVPRVIARMRDHRYESAYKRAGVATTVHIADVFANQLLLEIEEPNLRPVATFGAGKAAIVVDTVPQGAAVAGRTVQQIAAEADFPQGCVITGIYRPEGQTFIVPRGSARLLAGDRVFLVAEHRDLRRASKLLHRKGPSGSPR